jgi:hypothetical protein
MEEKVRHKDSPKEKEMIEEDDDWFFSDDRPIIGYCSKCGQVRMEFYTCRSGGETLPKENNDDRRNH